MLINPFINGVVTYAEVFAYLVYRQPAIFNICHLVHSSWNDSGYCNFFTIGQRESLDVTPEFKTFLKYKKQIAMSTALYQFKPIKVYLYGYQTPFGAESGTFLDILSIIFFKV